jgi:hypothetical protein
MLFTFVNFITLLLPFVFRLDLELLKSNVCVFVLCHDKFRIWNADLAHVRLKIFKIVIHLNFRIATEVGRISYISEIKLKIGFPRLQFIVKSTSQECLQLIPNTGEVWLQVTQLFSYE